ncbi:MAG: T9SS type A sorting domain-containing protein [Chitinophagales bacterium]|nr:T9SS type A sorting domain-containing protein [Chitinophagales bacterium]
MIRNIIIWLFIICSGTSLLAQNRANIWELSYQNYGPNCGIDFNLGYADTFSVIRKLVFFITNSSICDTEGNILFYTNGQWIANRKGDSLKNCNKFNSGYLTDVYYGGEGGNGMSQGAIALPDPGNSNRYYLFYETAESFNNQQYGFTDYQPFYLSYSVIDITLDNGNGGIIKDKKNMHAVNDTLLYGMITACKHANGRDWWIAVHKYNSDQFYTFLIDSNGVSNANKQKVGPLIKPLDKVLDEYFETDNTGEAAFSPNGNYYVFVEVGYHVRLFDFDRCTGLFSNFREDSLPLLEQYDNSPLGCSFSPSSKYLYVSTYWHLFQYNLANTRLTDARDDIARYDYSLDSSHISFETLFAFQQIAPDNKIYMSPWNGNTSYDVIDEPDHPDSNANFLQNGLPLPIYSSNITNFPNYDLCPLASYTADAGNDTTIIKGQSVQLGIPTVVGVKYQWKSDSSLSDTTISQPIALPYSTTTYYLSITDTGTLSSCNVRIDTVTVYVDIADGILHHQNFSKDFYHISPNPAHDWLNIVYSTKDNAELELYNQFGQMVGSISLYPYFKNRMLNVATLPTGIYMYAIKQGRMIIQGAEVAIVH